MWDMPFVIHKYTNYWWLHVQTYVKELHYFRSFTSVENGSFYNGYNIQQNVTLKYSTNDLEKYLFVKIT